PRDGVYTFTAMGAFVALFNDDCAGQPYACSDFTAIANVTKGQKLAVIITKPMAGSYTLSITASTSLCNVASCPSGPVGELPCCTADMTCGYSGPDGCSSVPSGVPPGADVMCMNSIAMLPGPYCTASAACSCAKCPQQHLACLTGATGCADILRCLQRS